MMRKSRKRIARMGARSAPRVIVLQSPNNLTCCVRSVRNNQNRKHIFWRGWNNKYLLASFLVTDVTLDNNCQIIDKNQEYYLLKRTTTCRVFTSIFKLFGFQIKVLRLFTFQFFKAWQQRMKWNNIFDIFQHFFIRFLNCRLL